MVERNADGTLKVLGSFQDEGFLREDPPAVREAMKAKVDELDRALTPTEEEEVRRSVLTDEG